VRARSAKISIQGIDSTNKVFRNTEYGRYGHQVFDLSALTCFQAHERRA
jgi:hypothetical protein